MFHLSQALNNSHPGLLFSHKRKTQCTFKSIEMPPFEKFWIIWWSWKQFCTLEEQNCICSLRQKLFTKRYFKSMFLKNLFKRYFAENSKDVSHISVLKKRNGMSFCTWWDNKTLFDLPLQHMFYKICRGGSNLPKYIYDGNRKHMNFQLKIWVLLV